MSDQPDKGPDSDQEVGGSESEGKNRPADFDFTSEKISEKLPSSPQVGSDYDPRPQEDNARKIIAFLLIGLLCFIVVSMMIMVHCGSIKVTEIKEFAVLLGPIVTLVSAATGFYYGTKSNSNNSK